MGFTWNSLVPQSDLIKKALVFLDLVVKVWYNADIRNSIRNCGKPNWMIVALTKADLYYDSLQQDLLTYCPDYQSEFSDKLNDLRNSVGKDNFRWETVPVCSWLENFAWNDQVVNSKLKQDDRDRLVMELVDRIKSYC